MGISYCLGGKTRNRDYRNFQKKKIRNGTIENLKKYKYKIRNETSQNLENKIRND